MSGVAPEDEAGIVEAVRGAHAAREPIVVSGAGSRAGMLRPVQAARGLSTRGLSGVTLYAPKELVVSARAGTPLAELETLLAENGQKMIAEPPDLSALFGIDARPTLGGLVATNLSGPRRISGGAVRDHVLGVRAVNGTGELIRSGGRVLKNVTGLDLCKLLTGSHGTLAVLTEVTLKVLPVTESTGTLVLTGLDAASGVAALSRALGSPFDVSGAAFLPAAAAAAVPELPQRDVALIRIEEFASSVRYRLGRLVETLASTLGSGGEAALLDDAASRAVWRAVRDAIPLQAAPAEAVWRVSVRPSLGPAVLEAVAAAGVRGFLDWSGGLVWLAGPASEAAHRAVCDAARMRRGTWLLLRGPEPLRAAVEVVPPEAAALAQITRRVKAAFDPIGILNPGRIYAGV